MEDAREDDEQSRESEGSPKTPEGGDAITLTKEVLEDMIASAVATHMKATEVGRKQDKETRGKRIIRMDEEEEAPTEQHKDRERVDVLLEQLQGDMKKMQEKMEAKAYAPKAHPFASEVLKAKLPEGFRSLSITYDGKTDPTKHL